MIKFQWPMTRARKLNIEHWNLNLEHFSAMSVYVDELRPVGGTGKWQRPTSCHLYADTLDELHELAGLIGLSRSWFQERNDFPHYDLSGHKRQQAIARGAVSVPMRHAAEFSRRLRQERLAKEGGSQ